MTNTDEEGRAYRKPLSGWTVYDHPKDYPDSFVARRWVGGCDGAVTPTSDMFTAPTLAEVRALLPLAEGLVCFPRADGDEPQIVEVWL